MQKVDIAQILQQLNISSLNTMQEEVLKVYNTHQHIRLIAPTGSGKTLAYLLPIAQQLKSSSKKVQSIVLAPSRELVLQIESVFKQMRTGFKVTVCYGGHDRETEENSLKEAPALLIGTPGRVLDHINRGTLNLESVQYVVLDEYDKMTELGFQAEVGAIFEQLKYAKHKMLISATDSIYLPEFMGMDTPYNLDFGQDENTNTLTGLSLSVVQSPDKDKINTLFQLICNRGAGQIVVFCNYRDAVKRTSELLADLGIPNDYYHGAMEQKDREIVLSMFRNGSVKVLVATDLAARGLDIPEIDTVIHYHLPQTEESFIHRNGRTARQHAKGNAYIILSGEETLPEFIPQDIPIFDLKEDLPLPDYANWVSLYFAAGKKDKVNKVDIVGFLGQKAGVDKKDIGLIDVKDYYAIVAVKRKMVKNILKQIANQPIKNKKVTINQI